MIYAELAGGLGNQMFIYAFARALGLRCGEEVTLLDRQDWRAGAPAHTVCGLRELSISPQVAILTQPGFAKQHLPRQNTAKAVMIRLEQRGGMMQRDWSGLERAAAPLLNRLGVHFVTDGYLPAHRGASRDFLAWGYFQSEEYFSDFADTIRAELRCAAPVEFDGGPCPVCVHLRRGDYQRPENAILQVCTPAYYAAALRRVAAEHPQATLYVFSDDIDWARAHLDPCGLPVVFMPRGSAAGDLARMQRCHHFVISNSTYSWWAQYLGDAPHKQVYAPDVWYAHTKHSALPQPHWTLVPTGLR
ncbi:MAG: alpha-1,2-fucosyltransferase [Gemmiger sp.]